MWIAAVSISMHLRKGRWTAQRMIAACLVAAPLLCASHAHAQPRMAMCSEGVRTTCVVDGDTFWLNGEKVRIKDIDTPEISKAECPAELELAAKATAVLIDLLNSGDWSLERDGKDRYGRTLAAVMLDGRSVGDRMIETGVAVRWTGRRATWC